MTNLDAFVVSGSDDKINKLKTLIEKRQLSNEDLALMLRTVKAREESKQEVKKWEKETEPKMRIIKESEDKSDYTIFGLDSRKFEIVGGYEDAVELRKLMDKKHMDHDEIELIVGCLKLK